MEFSIFPTPFFPPSILCEINSLASPGHEFARPPRPVLSCSATLIHLFDRSPDWTPTNRSLTLFFPLLLTAGNPSNVYEHRGDHVSGQHQQHFRRTSPEHDRSTHTPSHRGWRPVSVDGHTIHRRWRLRLHDCCRFSRCCIFSASRYAARSRSRPVGVNQSIVRTCLLQIHMSVLLFIALCPLVQSRPSWKWLTILLGPSKSSQEGPCRPTFEYSGEHVVV